MTTAYSTIRVKRSTAEASAGAPRRAAGSAAPCHCAPRRLGAGPLGRPGDLAAGPERGALEHLAQVALVEELGAADGALRSEVGHHLELGHLGDLAHDEAITRVDHRHLERPPLPLERHHPVVARVLFAHRRQGVELDVGHLEIDEPHLPRLGELGEEEGDRDPAALGERALEGILRRVAICCAFSNSAASTSSICSTSRARSSSTVTSGAAINRPRPSARRPA